MGQQTPHEQLWRPDPAAEGTAEQIAVVWRPYRPEVAVESIIDLVFVPGQCRARQELILRSPHSMPARLLLHVPPDIAKTTLSVQGGQLADDSAGKSVRRLTLVPVRNAEQDARVVLTYSFAAEPGANGRAPADLRAGLNIPLVWVESATKSETRLRVWSEPGRASSLASNAWTIQDLEIIKGHDRVPDLMALTHEPAPELKLQFADPSPASTVLVERALVRVNVLENVGQEYRASFRISHLSTQFLEAELPAAAGKATLKVRLFNPGAAPREIPPHLATGTDGLVVLRLDDIRKLIGRNTVVEIQYELPPSGLAPAHRLVQTVLQPPVLRGDPGRILTRWQVTLPAGWVVLGPEGGPGSEHVWGRRNWLLAPRLKQTSADLERWLVGADGAAAAEDSERRQRALAAVLARWTGTADGRACAAASLAAAMLAAGVACGHGDLVVLPPGGRQGHLPFRSRLAGAVAAGAGPGDGQRLLANSHGRGGVWHSAGPGGAAAGVPGASPDGGTTAPAAGVFAQFHTQSRVVLVAD